MHLEQEPTIRERKTAYGTVAVADMVGYSTLARMLEENMGAAAVADLNRQIQEFVRSALRHLDDPPGNYTKIAETGDGVILFFDSAHDAHVFAEQLHLNAAKHNRSRKEASAMRWFRIGISTGELDRDSIHKENDKYAGITIANAVRLESAAESGEIVMDLETFGILPRGDRISYGPETAVRGKREEVFIARRYKVVNSTHSQESVVKHPSRSKVFKLRAGTAAFAIALFTFLLEPPYVDRILHVVQSFFSTADPAVLQSVQAKPNLVKPGDTVTITVAIDRPAPKNGVRVNLSSDDQSLLTVDGSATVYQGYTSGTAYSRVVAAPNYRSPINIVATYNGETVRTQVSIEGQVPGKTIKPEFQGNTRNSTTTEIATANHMIPLPYIRPDASLTAQRDSSRAGPPLGTDLTPKPATLNPELVSRLEEAQGRLSAELSYWETMKRQMPPGTSLRPEIASQIYAAKSASQRCSNEVKASDAASLGPCIDSLNEHLNQLKLQH